MNVNEKLKRPEILFMSHGGGPLPLLGDPDHAELVKVMEAVASELPKPTAIIVISAHWEEGSPTITSASRPALIYDYYGFPPESYQIQYPAPGAPELARQVHSLLKDQGIAANLTEQRGYDHGMFVPLKIMYPQADIPCIQLSLLKSLNAQQHVALGAALGSLNDDGILILGSGFSFHNLREFFAPSTERTRLMNEAFETWLIETCSSKNLSEKERCDRLLHWDQAPHARYCHPREEHLLPLHVCYGAAQKPCRKVYEFYASGKKASAYLW